MKKLIVLLSVSFFLCISCRTTEKEQVKEIVRKTLEQEVIKRAEKALLMEPVTVTSFIAERSAGDKHDFFSEGDYWWPNPENPDGPYIQRDGETNPDNFVAHRHAMIRFSIAVADLTSGYLLTKDRKYIEQAIHHIRAWFMDPDTRMNPNLQYAQAIKGIVTGRGIGIIDTIHLIEVVQSLIIMEKNNLLPEEIAAGTKEWVSSYLDWLTTHQYGIDEMNAKNNHGTCWVMQVAEFARYTNNRDILEFCKERYKTILLPNQMAEDGSFPLELRRTKPYGYSLFNADAMATVCHILSDANENLWHYTTPDGKNMIKGVEWLYPYVADKSAWPYAQDVMYWAEWPVAHPFLLFAAYDIPSYPYIELWKELSHYPQNDEVVRNLPVRSPLLWL